MSIAKKFRALFAVTLTVVLCGYIPTVGTTIRFQGLEQEANRFDFYLRIEKIVEEVGFKRLMQRDEHGKEALLRIEDKKYYISSFRPLIVHQGEGVIDVSVYFYKKNSSIKLTMTQYPANQFSATAKTLFRNLISNLRNKFGRDRIVIEEKMKLIIEQQNEEEKN